MNEDELRQKRVYVGLIAIGCLIGGLALAFFPGNEGFQGALVRVGILMGAFWLALPTRSRPAAWKGLASNWALLAMIVTAVIIPRAKVMFPVLAVMIGLALFARPRRG